MKTLLDNLTIELPVIPAAKRGRGRPPGAAVAMTNAQRQAAYRAKKMDESGLVPVTVMLPADLVVALDKFLMFKDEKKSDVVARILRDRLTRKR